MKRFTSIIAEFLCISLLFTGCSGTKTVKPNSANSQKEFAVAEVKYPQMASYPDESQYFNSKGEFDDEKFDKVYGAWRADISKQRNQQEGYADNMEDFYYALTKQLLGNESENRVCSPLNIYLALSMLAEVTDGNSREQLLELIGVSDIEELHEKVSALWNANYRDDGAVKSILANSLWLNEDIEFNQEIIDILANNYYASSYQGEMGSDEFNIALQNWLNEQTGGLLENEASKLELDSQTILALASTIYFRSKWSSEFSKNATTTDVFHAPAGDIESSFMHKSGSYQYYWADNFSAISLGLESDGHMWLILPDEGVSFKDLFEDDEIIELCQSGGQWTNSKHLIVNLSVPRFDIVSDIDLIDQLKALGITDVFDPGKADFSSLTVNDIEAFVGQAKHAARVTIDEEGCVATAYTVMAVNGAGMPPEETVDFVLDRPFMFVITGQNSSILFAGTVVEP